MRNSYYNASHCADPTAFAAINNVTREERKINRPPKRNRSRRQKGRRRR